MFNVSGFMFTAQPLMKMRLLQKFENRIKCHS